MMKLIVVFRNFANAPTHREPRAIVFLKLQDKAMPSDEVIQCYFSTELTA